MSKSITKRSENFDLDHYLIKLLFNNNELNVNRLRKQIQTDIQSTKTQISKHLSKFGVDFNDFNYNFKRLNQLSQEIKNLEKQLNEFIESDLITKISELKDIYEENNNRFNRSNDLSDFIEKYKLLKTEILSIDDSFSLQSYELSVQHMTSASELYHFLIETIESNDDLNPISRDLQKYLNSMKEELTLKREELIYKTKKLFNSNVKVFRNELNNENIFEFNLIKCLNKNEYKSFVKTFVGIEENSLILSELIKSLNLFFIKPILNEEINEIVLEENQIIAKFIEKNRVLEPLSALKLFFIYFNQLLTDRSDDISRQLMATLGFIWTEDLFQQILRYYLNRLMPKNESEIKSYLSLVDSAEDIRSFLIEIGFIEKSEVSPFIDFALNINTNFCRRLCTDFIISGKTLICRELHQTIELKNDLENSLPTFTVSKYMIELKELFKIIIGLTNNSSKECSEALLQTIEDICELYIDVSPVYHNKIIKEFPQQNAIFHNNCIFFGHFIESFAQNNEKLINVLKFVSIVKELGSQVFLKQMQTQEKLLLDLIQNQEFIHSLNDLATEDKSDYCDQSVKHFRHVLKQCLVHLNFLKNALISVLPEKVYNRAIGTVINTLFNELINQIQVQNDISSSGAVRLSTQIEFLLKEIKQLLNTENPMSFVQKWSKLSELHFILNATLLDIVNRWAEGKGILSAHFTAQEIKQLIRALFQNTERRAHALNRITF